MFRGLTFLGHGVDPIHFTPETLFKIGNMLKSKTSSDPDGICYYLLKQILPVIASPLCLMYDSFMSVGKVPDDRITAVIPLLFKKMHQLYRLVIVQYH